MYVEIKRIKNNKTTIWCGKRVKLRLARLIMSSEAEREIEFIVRNKREEERDTKINNNKKKSDKEFNAAGRRCTPDGG